MSEIQKVWKLLLKKSFYEKYKNTLPINSFDEVGRSLLPTLEFCHAKANKDISCEELELAHIAHHPNITTASKNTIAAYLGNIKDQADIDASIADVVFKTLWRKEVGRAVAEFGIRLEQGTHQTVDDLNTYLSNVGESFIPDDSMVAVSTDPVELFTYLNRAGKWEINIPTLKEKIGKIGAGTFIVVLARPECGKSATIVNLMSGRTGFAAQGANTHLIANEEPVEVTVGRSIACYNEVPIGALKRNPLIGKTSGWDEVRKNMTFVHRADVTMPMLESYVKENKPDVLIIDQIDHLAISGDFEKTNERLGAIYRKARELACKYGMVVVGVTQASADAEGKSKVNFSMAAGSKTDKAAAADIIIGIGKVDDAADTEGNEVIRYYTASKNKVSGWHGTAVVRLIIDESRLAA